MAKWKYIPLVPCVSLTTCSVSIPVIGFGTVEVVINPTCECDCNNEQVSDSFQAWPQTRTVSYITQIVIKVKDSVNTKTF